MNDKLEEARTNWREHIQGRTTIANERRYELSRTSSAVNDYKEDLGNDVSISSRHSL
jgi:hypothetical protein